jgi:hypothetical protein
MLAVGDKRTDVLLLEPVRKHDTVQFLPGDVAVRLD